jgi:hypothetical protein
MKLMDSHSSKVRRILESYIQPLVSIASRQLKSLRSMTS